MNGIRRAGCSVARSVGLTRGFYHDAVASGPNVIHLESIYTQWKANPGSLDQSWKKYFEAVEAGASAPLPVSGASLQAIAAASKASVKAVSVPTVAAAVSVPTVTSTSSGGLQGIIRAYQKHGHRKANLDPTGMHQWRTWKRWEEDACDIEILSPQSHGFSEADMDTEFDVQFGSLGPRATLREVINELETIYCETVGVEYTHISNIDKVRWIRSRFEDSSFDTQSKERLLRLHRDLLQVDTFEQFLNTKYRTTKRFGGDGGEATVVGLNAALVRAAELGMTQTVIGMPHRARLNVLKNVVGKPLVQILAEFGDMHYDFDKLIEVMEEVDWLAAGDVKYHLGTSNDRMLRNGKKVKVTLEANPSHLETVNTVTLGRTRAKQFYLGDTPEAKTQVMPVIFHGDASFAGQGVVYETLQLAHVDQFDVGGTIHIIINNQVGFTTDPEDDRSTLYCSDIGKGFNIPIFHCNADDPAALAASFELAAEWRQKWSTDVILDVVCYRRYGHNETDAPEYTQPVLYEHINKLPRCIDTFSDKLVNAGVATREELKAVEKEIWGQHEQAFEASQNYVPPEDEWVATSWDGMIRPHEDVDMAVLQSGVDLGLLRQIGEALCKTPDGFVVHRGLKRQLAKKLTTINNGSDIDWATAEALAFGSLLLEGNHVRLTGQDVQRGTFAHRHCVVKHQEDGSDHCFLNNLGLGEQSEFVARNSILSEYGVLGFELGYSYENPHSLVIWEAQFGDFANNAQVVVDQLLATGEQKWMQQSGIVMLLPHGYMGQGAEHSSCRLERILQQCDDDEDDIPEFSENFSKVQVQKMNWQVANFTTPSNYFHALRRQQMRNFRKPLVVASPKNLFRLKECTSSLADMGPDSRYVRLYDERDPEIQQNPDNVTIVIFCSGKIYYELVKQREKMGLRNVAICTIEQIAPFPFERVEEILKYYSNVDMGYDLQPGNVVWCQEEPKNMGAWSYVRPRLRTVAREGMGVDLVVRYVGRRAAAAPATGYPKLHKAEQDAILNNAVLDYSLEGIGHARPDRKSVV